jgi:hypothetical protein
MALVCTVAEKRGMKLMFCDAPKNNLLHIPEGEYVHCLFPVTAEKMSAWAGGPWKLKPYQWCCT